MSNNKKAYIYWSIQNISQCTPHREALWLLVQVIGSATLCNGYCFNKCLKDLFKLFEFTHFVILNIPFHSSLEQCCNLSSMAHSYSAHNNSEADHKMYMVWSLSPFDTHCYSLPFCAHWPIRSRFANNLILILLILWPLIFWWNNAYTHLYLRV